MLRGRGAELAAVEAVLAGARGGSGRCVLVEGPEGSGRSSLLDAVAERADGWTVLRARAAPVEATMSHATLHQLLAPVAAGAAEGLSDAQRVTLGVVLGTHPAERGQVPVHGVALDLVAAAAARGPVLVVVDDVHWCDQASTAALLFVARRLAALPVVLLVAREEDAAPSLESWDVEDEWSAVAERVALAPLEDAVCAQWVAEVVPDLDPVSRSRVLALGGGQPGRLAEVLTALRGPSSGALAPEPWVSPRTRARVRAATAALSGAEAQVLLLVAAGGGGGVDDLLRAAELLGVPEGALDELERQRLVSTVGGATRTTDPLAGEVVYAGATRADRRRAHAAWADALARSGAAQAKQAELGHRVRAASGADEDLARRTTALAARTALDDPAAAGRLLEQAAALSEDGCARALRLVRAAELTWVSGQDERSEGLLAQLPDDPGPAAAAALHHLRAVQAFAAGDLGACREGLEDAVLGLGASEPEQAVKAVLLLGWVARWLGGDVRQVLTPELLAALPPAQRATLQHAWKLAAPWREATAQERVAAFDVLLDEVAGSVYPFVVPSVDTAVAVGRDGDLAVALDRRIERLSAGHGGLALADALLSRASVALMDLRLDEASDLLDRAVAAARGCAPTGELETAVRSFRSLVAHLRGAPAVWTPGASPDGPPAPSAPGLGSVVWAFGQADRGARDLAGTADRLRDLWPQDPGAPVRAAALPSAPDLVDVLVRLQEPAEEVARVLAELAAWDEGTRAPVARQVLVLARAVAASDPGVREALLHEAAAVGGTAFLTARCRLALGELLRRERRSIEAREHLQEAVDAFAASGLAVWEQRARTELEATGASRPGRPVGSVELTVQEARVAHEAARGLTNHQIAQSLDISSRTVAHHLQSAYAKLGAAGRRDLPARLAERSRQRTPTHR